ncbi:Hsd3b1 [Symbiodinium sp. CCMP2592]|nr:Hsd3b1 [Symbiodinium sp. CCMP2592]
MADLRTALVLGGGGWVGSALVLELLQRREELGLRCVVAADLPTAPCSAWLRSRARAFVEEGVLVEAQLDVTDASAVRGILERFPPRAVFNLAAAIDVRPEAPAGRLEEVNAQAPTNLARAAAGAGAVTFIHVSTLDVSYTGRGHRTQTPHPPEDLQLTSPIAYVRSKARGERFLADFAQGLSSMNTVVLRPGHIYAPLEGSARCAGDALAGFLRLFPPLQIGCPSVQMSMVSVETVVEARIERQHSVQHSGHRSAAVGV